MLKVMIVDDELIVRVGIQSCIHWPDYGCEVIAACESGTEAVAFFRKEVPDIVFTDIMMPEMNGIELVEYIRANCPQTKIVVLSCVNEIEYVKQAIRLGAEDYILKLSFTKDMLGELLTKLTAVIEAERKTRGEEQIYHSIRVMNREDAFRTLIAGKLNLQGQEELLDRLGYPYDPLEQYQMACLLVERENAGMEIRDGDGDMMRYGLLNMIREYFVGLPEYELVFLDDNKILMLFRQAVGQPVSMLYQEILKQLNHALKTHFNITVSMGISSDTVDRTALTEAFKKAEQLAGLRFFSGSGSFHDHEDAAANLVRIRRGVRREIREAVFSLDRDMAAAAIDTGFEELSRVQNHQCIPAIRRAVVETWIYILGSTIPEREDIPEDNDICPISCFWEAETLGGLKVCLKDAAGMIIDYLSDQKMISPEVARLLAYLDAHVDENISLEQAAARCSLGKSQFCQLFKKATGETFVNYFNGLKMRWAYALLGSCNVQVQEAAGQVGIRDISYFSRLFKKYHRISPSEVRKL